jgi:hypothetical protein
MAVIRERMTSELEGDFVVFCIGMKVNRWWKIHKWWPVFTAMPKMLLEQARNPEIGLLATRSYFNFTGPMVIQYWRSFDHLMEYALNPKQTHQPAWAAFMRNVGLKGDVGIWHETFLVRAGEYECIYSGMPPFGLGVAGTLKKAVGASATARGRASRQQEDAAH